MTPPRFRRWIAWSVVAGLALVPLTPSPGPALRAKARHVFGGVGAWIDIYDDAGWADPEGTVLSMKQHGVRTLYLETCNSGCKEDVHRPLTVSRWIDAAHANGMKIVAWYLPELDDMTLDTRRSLAAVNFVSATDGRFDGFGLDIESRAVTPVGKRNKRIVELSRRIREAAGRSYPLGAITPVWFYEWGGPFPYRAIDPLYDVFIPMIYFSYRAGGPKSARLHTARNIQEIREATGSQKTPIHAIGGIADRLNAREVGAFVATARRRHSVGVSLYDYFTSTGEDWTKLATWR